VRPAKAVGENEMPFGRDTRVVPSNIVFNKDPDPQEGEIWGSEPFSHAVSNNFPFSEIKKS